MTYLYPAVKRSFVFAFSLLFSAHAVFAQAGSADLSLSPSQPLSILIFQVSLKEKSALLNWTTTNHYNFSHFTIEKSNDAKNFKETTVLFAAETTSAETSFNYKDNLQNNTEKITYYRLKMVDVNGKASYSETRMVRAMEENKIMISTFPNPAVNELHVMIPGDWQEKQVTYDIYNNNGVLIQHYQNKQAAQIQQLDVQQLKNGNYFLKISNATTSTTSSFIKY